MDYYINNDNISKAERQQFPKSVKKLRHKAAKHLFSMNPAQEFAFSNINNLKGKALHRAPFASDNESVDSAFNNDDNQTGKKEECELKRTRLTVLTKHGKAPVFNKSVQEITMHFKCTLMTRDVFIKLIHNYLNFAHWLIFRGFIKIKQYQTTFLYDILIDYIYQWPIMLSRVKIIYNDLDNVKQDKRITHKWMTQCKYLQSNLFGDNDNDNDNDIDKDNDNALQIDKHYRNGTNLTERQYQIVIQTMKLRNCPGGSKKIKFNLKIPKINVARYPEIFDEKIYFQGTIKSDNEDLYNIDSIRAPINISKTFGLSDIYDPIEDVKYIPYDLEENTDNDNDIYNNVRLQDGSATGYIHGNPDKPHVYGANNQTEGVWIPPDDCSTEPIGPGHIQNMHDFDMENQKTPSLSISDTMYQRTPSLSPSPPPPRLLTPEKKINQRNTM